jgi:hypothetical protein
MFMRFPDKTPRESEADHTFPITAKSLVTWRLILVTLNPIV